MLLFKHSAKAGRLNNGIAEFSGKAGYPDDKIPSKTKRQKGFHDGGTYRCYRNNRRAHRFRYGGAEQQGQQDKIRKLKRGIVLCGFTACADKGAAD